MKLVDEKGKFFGLLNAIDFFVIALVVVIATGTYYKFGVMGKTSKVAETQNVQYVVEIKRVRDFIFENVKVGDEIYDKVSGNSIGVITNIEGSQAEEPLYKSDGTGTFGEVQNRFDVELTVEAQGVITDGKYYANKTFELVVDSKKKFMTKYFEAEGAVKEIIK